jgi:phosphocarrier protein
MVEASIVVHHEVGLHARPAASFVKLAGTFDSDIKIANVTRGTDTVDAKSVIQVFKIAVAQNHEIRLTAEGSDEQEALDALVGLIESNFGE